MSRPAARSGGPALWVAVRVTGLVLAVLVLGHFALTHIVTDVADTDAAFVADRLGSLLYLAWDAVMLVFAVVHGAIGVGVAIHEYFAGPLRRALHAGLAALALAMITGGVTVLAVAA